MSFPELALALLSHRLRLTLPAWVVLKFAMALHSVSRTGPDEATGPLESQF